MDRYGTASAIFHLKNDSPLPAWLVIPEGISRDQISVTITEYEATTTERWKVRFVVRDSQGHTIQEAVGTGFWHPDSERERAPAATFPNWTIIETRGTKEVYEQSEFTNSLKIVNKP
jgi:hypothetical protein